MRRADPLARSIVVWLGIACIALGPLAFLPHGGGLAPAPALAVTLLGVVGIAWGERVRQGASIVKAVGTALALTGAAVIAQSLLAPMIWSQARLSWLAEPLSWLLRWRFDACVTREGELALAGHEGTLRFAMTAQAIALLPTVGFYVAGLLYVFLHGGRGRVIAALLAATTTLSFVRLGFIILRFADGDRVLADPGPVRTESLQRPLELFIAMAIAGLITALVERRASASDERRIDAPRLEPGHSRRVFAAFLVGGVALLLPLLCEASGTVKRGRILVDDRLSDSWAPSARRLDEQWFGDFATYSLSSLVELLGYSYVVDVNVNRRYDDELLRRYDVLVLKIPSRDLAADERSAILRWTHAGGGMLLVGDHTDLLGSSTRLNELARPCGLEFRSDSVMDGATGGFSLYRGTSLGAPHPAAIDVDAVEFMTSCSLLLNGSAKPMLVVDHQTRQDHDFGETSNFGSLFSDPRMDLGPLALAASAEYGDGRVIAFADSTILSSFAVFEPDRETLAVGMIEYLNHTAGRISPWFLACELLGACCLAMAFWTGRRASFRHVLALLGFAGWLALVIALPVARAVNKRAYPRPLAENAPPRLAVLRSNTEALFPPVLGTPAGYDMDHSYDTLSAAISRSGVAPRPAWDWSKAMEERGVLVLNPRQAIDAERQAQLREYVASGGELIVAVRSDHYHMDALRSLLDPFGVHLSPVENDPRGSVKIDGGEARTSPTPRMMLRSCAYGRGGVHLVWGSEWWSRKRLGHCFSVPDADKRAAYALIAQLLRNETRLAPADRRVYGVLE